MKRGGGENLTVLRPQFGENISVSTQPVHMLAFVGDNLLEYCSFFTFSRMPQVKEIIVVCDPSYQDIFEGMNFKCLV